MSIQIITDSACDLPQELVREYGIDVLPFLVIIDGKEYQDGINITTKEVYDAIRADKVPTTAQVPIDQIAKTFKKYAEQGRECLYLSFSSKLSGTCNTVQMVAQEMMEKFKDFKVTIVDTLSGSRPGLIIWKPPRYGRGLILVRLLTARKRSNSNVDISFR